MALAINVDSTNWGTNYVDQAVPYLDEAIGLYLFGGSAALSIINHAPGASVDLTSNGTPTYGEGYVAMDYNTDFFETGINTAGSQTLIVVVTRSTGSDYYIKNDNTTLLLGQASAGSNNTNGRFSGAFGGLAIATFNPGTVYGFLAGTTAGTTGEDFEMFSGFDDVLTKTEGGTLGGNVPSSEIIIGPTGFFSGSGVGHRNAFTMVVDRKMTQAELEEIYAYCRFKLPKRGIQVA